MLGEVGSRVYDSRAPDFKILVSSETAESISVGIFMDNFKEMLFSTMCENCFQFFYVVQESGNYFGWIL